MGQPVTKEQERNYRGLHYVRTGCRDVETNQPLARLAFGLGGAAALGALCFAALPSLVFFLAAFPPRKQAQKPQTATRGDGGSRAGETRPADALYPASPVERLRSARTGLLSPDRWLSSSHTIPDEPDRRNVPLDRCSPAIHTQTYSRAAGEEELRPHLAGDARRSNTTVHTPHESLIFQWPV